MNSWDARAGQELAQRRWEGIDEFAHQQVGESVRRPGECGEGVTVVAVVGREIDGGDPDQRGPALGERHQGPQRLRVEVAAVLRAEPGGLLRRQREVRRSPPGEPGMQFQQMPSDRRIEPRAQHGGHRRWGVSQEVFQPGQGERVGDQMGVVEDQDRRCGIVGERGDHRLGLTDAAAGWPVPGPELPRLDRSSGHRELCSRIVTQTTRVS